MSLSSAEPDVGYGTYPLTGKVCAQAVEQAAECGYHIFDTATFYGNFEAVAKGLKKFDRGDFYIISKVWHDKQTADDLRKDLDSTLKKLQLDYLDAYLVHWPNSEIPIEETLGAMEELWRKGRIRHIGLSNVTVNHLRRALELAIPITWVQVEMNPFFYDAELLKFCQEWGIGVQAWAPLARGRIKEDAMLMRIGKKYGKTPSQVAIRWILQHGCLPLPGSKDEKHMHENRDVYDFKLSAEEMAEIDKRAKSGQRERVTKKMIGFADEFDYSYEQCWPK